MSDYEHLIELSNLYILSQEFNEALKLLKKAEKLNKLDPKLYYNMGIAYEGLNDNEHARNAFRLALKLDPTLVSAREHLDRLIEE